MASLYELYLWVHILAAIVWVGGGVMIQVLALRILRANEPLRLTGFARDVEWVGTRVFVPVSVVLIVFGFLLVERAGWGYPFWVVFAIAIWALSALSGAVFLGPESGRIGKLVAERGPEDAEVQRRIRRILAFSRAELLLLVAVVFDMTIKPFA